jgi:hypothetical protein
MGAKLDLVGTQVEVLEVLVVYLVAQVAVANL